MRKAFICPTKYVQGENELLNLGYFVKTFGKKALLIADPFALNLVKDKLEASAKKYGVEFVSCGDVFKGECSRTVKVSVAPAWNACFSRNITIVLPNIQRHRIIPGFRQNDILYLNGVLDLVNQNLIIEQLCRQDMKETGVFSG